MKVKWTVSFHDEFDSEFGALSEAVQDEMLAHARLLEQFGPLLGRPRVDTLKGSRHANMKELRFDAAEPFGALLSLSTRSARLSFSLRVTSQAAAKSVFIGS